MMTRAYIQTNYSLGKLRILFLLSLVLSFSACSKEELPKDGNIAYANFVHAGEAFLYSGNDNLPFYNRLYINDSTNNEPFNNYNSKANYPFEFGFEPSDPNYVRRLPEDFSNDIGGGVLDNVSGDVYWLGLKAGAYKFIFTSKDKTYLKTTNLSLQQQSYNILYLVENAETDSTYSIINVPISRPEKKAGVMGIQFVNLSPDAGAVDIIRVDSAGNEISNSLPKKLPFGENGFADLSMQGTEETNKRMLFRVKYNNGEFLPFSIPANSGTVYTVMLRGFTKQTLRKVKKDNTTYASVTVLPDFRASVRRVFY